MTDEMMFDDSSEPAVIGVMQAGLSLSLALAGLSHQPFTVMDEVAKALTIISNLEDEVIAEIGVEVLQRLIRLSESLAEQLEETPLGGPLKMMCGYLGMIADIAPARSDYRDLLLPSPEFVPTFLRTVDYQTGVWDVTKRFLGG